eukprot:Pgem_evm1s10794
MYKVPTVELCLIILLMVNHFGFLMRLLQVVFSAALNFGFIRGSIIVEIVEMFFAQLAVKIVATYTKNMKKLV